MSGCSLFVKEWSFEGEERHWMNKDSIFFVGMNRQDSGVENGKIIEHMPKVIFKIYF